MTVPHTPGPWNFHIQGDADDYCLLTHDGKWIISFRQNGELLTPEQIANAHLIATAPDLLEALEYLMSWQVKNVDRWHNAAYDNAARVVKKATGETK